MQHTTLQELYIKEEKKGVGIIQSPTRSLPFRESYRVAIQPALN